MANLYDSRFEINVPYSKNEFIFRLEVIISANYDDELIIGIAEKNIAWAKEHDDNLTFAWEYNSLGALVPVATANASFPVDDQPQEDHDGHK